MLIHLIVILFPWYFRTIPEKKANEGFQFWEAHHFFTGSLLATIGFFLIFKMSVSNFVSGPLLFFGTWLMVDDWIQHMAQKAEIEEEGVYSVVTFWHWFPYRVLDYLGLR